MAEIKAFIFDLDGVITDTAKYHYRAWKQLGEDLNINFDREFNEQLKGISRMDSLERILKKGKRENDFTQEEKIELATKKNEHYKQLITQITSEDILPGIMYLLNELKDKNIKIALASASKNAPVILERLGIKQYFDYIVDPASVKKGKPAPDIFVAAAEYFGYDSKQCIGIEDAAAGIDAINSADMFSVGVGDKIVLNKADYCVKDTSKLKYKDVYKQIR